MRRSAGTPLSGLLRRARLGSRGAQAGGDCRPIRDEVVSRLFARDGWPSPVEGAALEMLYSRKAVLGSNPNPSAKLLGANVGSGVR